MALLVGLGGPVLAAGQFYCCADASGKQVCSDTLPQVCVGKAYREVGQSGRTVKEVAAPLTPEQRAQQAAEEERRKKEEEARKEQARKDQALLNTYGTEKDIEVMRQRAQGDVQKSIKNAENKILEIKEQRKKYENEAEFYKKRQLPPEIEKGLKNADFEITAQESIIEAKKKELDIIRAKYDDDKRRFIDLTRAKARTQ